MARPTKEEIEKRQKIIDLGLFVRDSKIYTNFENGIGKSNLTLTDQSHFFCDECITRDFINSSKNTKFRDFKNEIKNIELEKLEKINYFSYIYYSILYLNKDFINRTTRSQKKNYEVNNVLELQHIINALGDKYKYNVLTEDYYMSISLDSLVYTLNREEKEKLLEYCIQNGVGKTFINHESIDRVHDMDKINDGRLNRVNIELDLTKPKEEILKYISIIKDDYDKDPSNIPSIYNILGLDLKNYSCELSKCDIYKSKNPKPINGRLTDILFIYDCKKIGLHDEYIKDEINRYWNDIKKLYRDKFPSSTLNNYHKFSKKYIEDKEYKFFISGYDLSSI